MCVEAWGALAERSLAGTQRDDAVPRDTEYASYVHSARPASSPEPAFPGQAETSSACASVFEAYPRAGLEAAAAGAHEEDDGQEEEGKAGAAALDERMSSVARVARAGARRDASSSSRRDGAFEKRARRAFGSLREP